MVDIEKLSKIKEEELPQILNFLSLRDDKYIIEDNKVRLKGDYYEKQLRIALKNYDIIDPYNIKEYIAFGGYFSLAKALTK